MTNPADRPGTYGATAPATAAPSSSSSTSVTAAAAEPVAPAPPTTTPGLDENGKVARSRVSGVWIGLIAAAIFLILLITFIAQNSRRATVHFLWWDGRFSIGLTILLSAVIGMLLVALPGSVRIVQLRRALRKNAPAAVPAKSRGGRKR